MECRQRILRVRAVCVFSFRYMVIFFSVVVRLSFALFRDLISYSTNYTVAASCFGQRISFSFGFYYPEFNAWNAYFSIFNGTKYFAFVFTNDYIDDMVYYDFAP